MFFQDKHNLQLLCSFDAFVEFEERVFSSLSLSFLSLDHLFLFISWLIKFVSEQKMTLF